MKVLYINYINTNLGLSGAEVRPIKILNAFLDAGYEVISLTGEQTHSQRKRDIRNFWNKIKNIQITDTICYIESPVYPIWRHGDRKLIRKIHKKGIPIGYFYRDFYRKFPEQFPRRTGFLGHLKDYALDFLEWRTDRTLQHCNIVYLPSEEASFLFNFKNQKSLPPAGNNHLNGSKLFNHTGIYVGGVHGYYDVSLLLNSFNLLYEEDNSYHLILVSRAEEWEQFKHPYKNAKWLEVHHTSKEGLVPLYNRASVAFVCPNKSFSYNSFAVSVKTFEYISYGLPVIGINCKALSKIIKDNKIGITTDPDIQSFCEAVKHVLKDEKTYRHCCDNVREALLSKNLWSHRINKIVNDLSRYL